LIMGWINAFFSGFVISKSLQLSLHIMSWNSPCDCGRHQSWLKRSSGHGLYREPMPTATEQWTDGQSSFVMACTCDTSCWWLSLVASRSLSHSSEHPRLQC
jgi:hypothetical protein